MIDGHDLEFRKIPSLNYLYEVNENGTIFRNVKTGFELKIKLDKHHSLYGYYVTFVHLGGRRKDAVTKRVMIHTVVAECWLGEKPEGYQVDHIDRNAHNNDYHNLRYVTYSEQMKNRDHSGISKRGTANLEKARNERKKSVVLLADNGHSYSFDSQSGCARWLADNYPEKSSEQYRYQLRRHYKKICEFTVLY